jgi:hypothetical protein
MAKERYQKPVCGDTVNLRLFTYNANSLTNVRTINEIKIYVIDDALKDASNPEGLRLVQTVSGSSVELAKTGEYILSLYLDPEFYGIGTYYDFWNVTFESGECPNTEVRNTFQIASDLWFTSSSPIIYDFNFQFRPNRIRKGSKRYVLIKVTPNVPQGADLVSYYDNLAIVSDIRVSMEISCGECVPAETDLRLVVDRHLVEYRQDSYAYWFLDTTQLDEGIYNIWFETVAGENTYISEKYALQIYS